MVDVVTDELTVTNFFAFSTRERREKLSKVDGVRMEVATNREEREKNFAGKAEWCVRVTPCRPRSTTLCADLIFEMSDGRCVRPFETRPPHSLTPDVVVSSYLHLMSVLQWRAEHTSVVEGLNRVEDEHELCDDVKDLIVAFTVPPRLLAPDFR